MSDQADMMLDGTLCEGCGEYLGGTEYACPLLCDRCAKDRRREGRDIQRVGLFWQDWGAMKGQKPLKLRCMTCRKMVKVLGMKDHVRVKHPPVQPYPGGILDGTDRTTSGAIGQP